ncbi:MAG: FHA domain-containing protein [Lachnospiraceae bacterium]|nr:FHA domain-containing protein [Lachnospiraceae bacterium]
MSMRVCGQTLVLVDNDATVSDVNQKIVKTTLKYLFYHKKEDRTFCLNTYEHDILSEEDYNDDVNDLVCEVDNLEFTPKDSNLCDTISEVIGRWKASDFACRDILVFSDGIEGAATGHEKEEMYYLLENSGYPVYVVMLSQENNAAERKSLSAIATTSGGKLFETDFKGSDAGIDRQLTEMIFSAMDEYALVHWKEYEEEDEDQAESEISEEIVTDNTTESADAMEESEPVQEIGESGKVIYEYDESRGFFESRGALVLAAVLILAGLIVGILGGFILMKRRRAEYDAGPHPKRGDDEEEYFEDFELNGVETVMLGGDSGGTRLLDTNGKLVTLTDCESSRAYRIVLCGSMSVGRGGCDVTITGDDALSKRHCELYEDEGEVYVKDLASSNGTKVNGVRISAIKLKNDDRLTIGARTYAVGIE